MRMYHPNLGVERDFPDDPGCIAVQEESGWRPAPEPKRQSAAHEPEPVTYAPVEPDKGDAGEPEKSKGRKAT